MQEVVITMSTLAVETGSEKIYYLPNAARKSEKELLIKAHVALRFLL